ncbi:MAG: nicotinate (nicotinamide) nucleotide adenylyltransferase [Pseudobdellovibrionaceae bacterium]|nr:nicotinate (nicotinamide) nucleotide adenylyltransferase [Bdellovibrionales bacterium]USN46901.1 MAG: nicotinate (nicotinamide) nucleotide adenylyltransferase [Pseudobdellovibrionaceae bacterium]
MTNKVLQRIGLFGGTFNPLHNGHVNSIETVYEKLNLDHLYVIPASQSPLGDKVEGPSPLQRFEMVKVAFENSPINLRVEGIEIERGGISYTIDTVKYFKEKLPGAELYLIVGLDQFEHFDQWFQYEELLEEVNLVVASRPGAEFPQEISEYPKGLQGLVMSQEGLEVPLATDRRIIFVQLEDLDVSATEIRKSLRSGARQDLPIPEPVQQYIESNHLYEPLSKKIDDFERFTKVCAEILFEKNARGVLAFDVRNLVQPSEFTIVASGASTRNTSALAEHVVRQVKTRYGIFPQSIEGLKEGRWVVLDYGSLIVHLFYDYVRQEYRLEDLWREGRDMKVSQPENRVL